MEKFVSTMYDAITQGMEKEFPERVAFRYYTEETDTVTTVLFKELAQDVRRTVTCLQSTIPDVKGKKICLLSKNSYEYVVNTFGAIMAGCVLVPMNQRKSCAEMADKIDLTKPLPGHYMVLPMFHLGAFIDLFSTTVMGWPLNLGSDIRNFYRDIQKMPSQIMSVVPMIMNALHKDVMRGHRDRLGDLWVPIGSSAMFDPQVLLDMVHNGMFVIQCYGATETCGAGIINFAQDEKHIGAVGQGSEYMDYKIEPDGELCMRGDCVMMGYYKDPEGTAEVIDKDGWVHTGDLARVDEDGYYYITGRKKNLIILDSGENISPEELEGMLEKCPAVQECIVKELGKKIGVVVYCEKEHQQTVRDFIAQMNRTVPLYKRIGVVEFSETPLPRNGAGKLVRK